MRLKTLTALALAGACGLALCAVAGQARAAAVTQTVPVSAGPITFSDTGVDAFAAPFDPALGTLTAVTLRLTGALTPGVEAFDVPSPLPAVFATPVTFNPQVSIRVPGGATQLLPAETVPFAQDGAPVRQRAVGTPEAVDLSETVAPEALLVFPSRGVDVYITGHSSPAFGVPSPGFFGVYEGEDLVALNGQLAATYTYTPFGTRTPVPEPASLELASSGLAGLGLAARRRRRHPLA